MGSCISVRFDCECGGAVVEQIGLPDPDFSYEKIRESIVEDFFEVSCVNCGLEYLFNVTNGFAGADCSLVNSDNKFDWEVEYYPDDDNEVTWLLDGVDSYSVFKDHVKSIEELLGADVGEDARFSLLVMLHGHLVAAVEGYLSSTFIALVSNSDELTQKLVETDPYFSEKSFTLKEIFEKQKQLKLIVAKYLRDLVFHRLEKVKPMYRSVFEHDFGDISWLFGAVALRHHCVHRAGYDHDGNRIDVSENTIRELLRNSVAFVEGIKERAGEIVDGDLAFF